MILDEIVAAKKKRLPEHKNRVSPEQMKEKALKCTGSCAGFLQALKKPGLSIIGEFKQASPSMGIIQQKVDLEERIRQYSRGADAISCLTEEDYFNGNVEYFEKVRKLSRLPILRKDFIIDEYQIYEAKVIGADAVLLIAAILEEEQMKRFFDLTRTLGMDALVEVHDECEMERALKLDGAVIGINNRNLKGFTISLETTRRLARMVPSERTLVSESGVGSDEDIRFLKTCRMDALLAGRALMESEHPEGLLRHWKEIYSEKEGREQYKRKEQDDRK